MNLPSKSSFQPSVSVALCTHNGALFVEEQVRSICQQTLRPVEIVLSDDASQDNTVAIVQSVMREFAGRPAPALRVIQNDTPLGVSRNFESAIGHCVGDLVALCDQDDIWPAGRLETMVGVFERRNELTLLHTDARLVSADGAPIGHTAFFGLEVTARELQRIHAGDAFSVFLRRNLVIGATCIFRRNLMTSAAPMPDGWIHDEWLGAIAASCGVVDVLEQPLIDYRQHARNLIGVRRLTFLESIRKAFAPRGDIHQRRYQKACAWLARLEQLSRSGVDVPEQRLQALRDRLEHQKLRADLPSRRLARVAPLLKEFGTGRYGRFGRGLRGLVRDLFEPA